MINGVPGSVKTPGLFGDLLIADGMVSRRQLYLALDIQKKELRKIKHFNLSDYLVGKGIIGKRVPGEIGAKYRLNQRIGETLVSDGVITTKQLETALSEKKPHQFLGETFVKLRYIDKSQLYKSLARQFSVPSFETILVREGLISENRLKEIVLEQTLPHTIGEILTEHGVMTTLQLFKELKKSNKRRPVGEMMVDAGLISEEQLELALEKQKFSNRLLGETLVSERLLSEIDFYRILARQFALPFKLFEQNERNALDTARMKKIIGAKDALRYRMLPVSFENKVLKLALFNPHDMERLEELESIIDFDVSMTLVRQSDFEEIYKRLYDTEEMDISIEDMGKSETGSIHAAITGDDEAKRLADLIVSYGIKAKASDIHIENDLNGIHVRYRIDGALRKLDDPAIRRRLQAQAAQLVSRIKVMADLDIAESRLPQEGAFRVAICRSAYGEDVVIKILDSGKADGRLDQLSHSVDLLANYVQLLKNPSGMILVTGPAGSGKSSTLYASLRHLNHPDIKIVTAEDHVEFKVAGMMQTRIDPETGLTFAKQLKSLLRLDPDIIMVGEIRDSETAQIAMEAAVTGRLLLSSMHTNDAIGAISRLRDFGLSNRQIASTVKGIVAQRLVRAICENCKRPYVPRHTEWNPLFPEEPVHFNFYKGYGCNACNHTGTHGRIAISELLLLTPGVVDVILNDGDENKIYDAARKEGMKTMIEDGFDKLDKTALSELTRVIPQDAVERQRTESSLRHSMFPGFKPPENATVEYQVLLTRSKQGFSKEIVHELYNRYRNFGKRLNEPTDHLTEVLFTQLFTKKLRELDGGTFVNYRVTLLNRNKRATIMVEAAVPQ